MSRLGGRAFYKAKGTKDPSRRKPQRRHRVVYLADICTCGHERHVHRLEVGPFDKVAPPNFGRTRCTCSRLSGARIVQCPCPMFVMDRQALARKAP